MKKILVIEDEPNILELILYNLSSNGYKGIGATDGTSGLKLIEHERPDLILLDIMVPFKDGFEILKELREKGNNTPVIMLTAKADERDRVKGLDWGADDYITKPFGVRELLARIKAVLRRYEDNSPKDFIHDEEEESPEMVIDSLRIDGSNFNATVHGKELPLTVKEFELLHYLVINRGKTLSRNQLLDKVWGIEYMGETRTVDVHIRHLRKKLSDASIDKDMGEYIETLRGRGYRFR